MDEVIEVADLPNIGKVLAQELKSVGINNSADLEKYGSAKALVMIKASSAKGCYNMLYALEGAIQKTRWHNLSKEQKESVKNELISLLG